MRFEYVDLYTRRNVLWFTLILTHVQLILDFYTAWKQKTSQNGQTHSNNSSASADELFECVWPFCEIFCVYGVNDEL